MDPRIENLETTTFFGKRLTRRQIAVMQEMVELFPNDSRRELARTLCENLDWHTPSGSCREQFCLRVLEPVTLEVAADGRDLAEWTELVDRCHPRGCRSPIGCHLAYFVLDGSGRRLGCLMFESSGSLPVRDAWIGWTERQREDGLRRVVRHSRFLVFPWVRVRNLASRRSRRAAAAARRDGRRSAPPPPARPRTCT